MTATTLALLIAVAMVAQVTAFGFAGWRRRRRAFDALGRGASGIAVDADSGTNSMPAAAWEGLREFVVRRREVEDASASVCSFYLEPADGRPLPTFRPGQYLTFALDLPAAGGASRSVTRCYSLSDAPNERHYRVTIKRVPAPAGQPELPRGLVSNYFHDAIDAGTRLRVKAPAGRFQLRKDVDAPLVLIGGGIGITPMLSMLNTTLHEEPEREVWLFYGVRNGAEHIMKEPLRAMATAHPNFHLHVCYSDAAPSDRLGTDYQHDGRIDATVLRNTLSIGRYQFYVCGPGPMMASLVPAIEDLGVATEDIHYESFGPSAPKRALASDGASGSVTFSASGRTLDWAPEAGSLLAFAEDHGIDVESGCRSGSCGGCQTRLERGQVTYLDEPTAEIAEGHCLLCVSVPQGDIALSA